MPRTATAQPADTRTKILDAAIAEIAERGWGGTTTRSVAERASVNNALVHYHFRSKEALLLEATGEAMARELAGPVAAMLDAPTLVQGLRGFGAWLRDVDLGRPAVAVFAEALVQAGRREDVRDLTAVVLDDFRTSMRARLAEDQRAGDAPRELDPSGFAVAVSALLDGLVVHRLVDPQLDPLPAIELFTAGTLGRRGPK